MIITIAGQPGSGKSTCARGLCAFFNYKHYSTGDLMREIAEERGLLLSELSTLAESDDSIDKELDRRQKVLGLEENDFVIDGRLSAFFIPQAFKIFVGASLDVRAKRIFQAKRKIESSDTIEDMKIQLESRQKSEVLRYEKWYQFNPYNESTYDLFFDTSKLTENEMIENLTILVEKKIALKSDS